MSPETQVAKVLIPVPAWKDLENALTWASGMVSLTVSTDEEQENAARQLGQARKWVTDLETKKKSITKEWKENKEFVDREFKRVTDALTNVTSVISRAVGRYQQEVERKRREEQAKRDAEAAAERQRAEEKARAEMAKAEEYTAQGRTEMADKAIVRAESAVVQATTTVAAVVEERKPSGTSFRTVYKAKIVDKAKAVAAIMARPELDEAIEIKTNKLETLQNTLKGKLVLDGVTFIQESVVSVRK